MFYQKFTLHIKDNYLWIRFHVCIVNKKYFLHFMEKIAPPMLLKIKYYVTAKTKPRSIQCKQSKHSNSPFLRVFLPTLTGIAWGTWAGSQQKILYGEILNGFQIVCKLENIMLDRRMHASLHRLNLKVYISAVMPLS